MRQAGNQMRMAVMSPRLTLRLEIALNQLHYDVRDGFSFVINPFPELFPDFPLPRRDVEVELFLVLQN